MPMSEIEHRTPTTHTDARPARPPDVVLPKARLSYLKSDGFTRLTCTGNLSVIHRLDLLLLLREAHHPSARAQHAQRRIVCPHHKSRFEIRYQKTTYKTHEAYTSQEHAM